MTLPRHDSFTTDDPRKLAKELERFFEDVSLELAALADAKAWTTLHAFSAAAGTTFAAGEHAAVVCYDFDITVRPPIDPQPGDVFRTVHAGTGNVAVIPDDGTTVNLAVSDTLSVSGFREYMFANGGWWSQA